MSTEAPAVNPVIAFLQQTKVNIFIMWEDANQPSEGSKFYEVLLMQPEMYVEGLPIVMKSILNKENVTDNVWEIIPFEDPGYQKFAFFNLKYKDMYANFDWAQGYLTLSTTNKAKFFVKNIDNNSFDLLVDDGGGFHLGIDKLESDIKIGVNAKHIIRFSTLTPEEILPPPEEPVQHKKVVREVLATESDHDKYPEHIDYNDPPYIDNATPSNTPAKTPTDWKGFDYQSFYEMFAPVVYLDTKEDNGPSSVDWFLQKVDLMKRVFIQTTNGTYAMTVGVTKSKPGFKDLEDKSDGPFTHPYHDGAVDKGKFLKENDSAHSRAGMPLESGKVVAPVYLNPRIWKNPDKNDTDEYWDLEYFFFYPYNGFLKHEHDYVGNHVGDWERVSIRVNKTKMKVVKMAYKGHDGEPVCYTEKHIPFEGVQPVVYAAYHSHANYHSIGEHNRGALPNDYTSQGQRWDTSNNVIEVNYRHPDLNDQQWIRFNGLWGDTWGIITKSPDGPAQKKDFFRVFDGMKTLS